MTNFYNISLRSFSMTNSTIFPYETLDILTLKSEAKYPVIVCERVSQ